MSHSILTQWATELDDVAQRHCDKWLEETARHMHRYLGSASPPLLNLPNHPLFKLNKVVIGKSFSGDMSGLIGEALFALLLEKYFMLKPVEFVHLAANKSTGIFPDFGLLDVSAELIKAFADHQITNVDLNSVYMLPAEVKALVKPDETLVKNRLYKAVCQIKGYWKRQANQNGTRSITRGPSLIFVAMRNHEQTTYDGVILWMS